MFTSVAVLVPLLLGGFTLLLFLPVLRSLCRATEREEITPEWLESFSVSAYAPMQRLLAEEDFTFLSRQPGFDRSLHRKLRRERLHIFRQYLIRLIIDFNRLHTFARLILARSSEDRSDVVAKLMWLKVRFLIGVLQAESSYFLCWLGFRFLATERLIAVLESMSIELARLSDQPVFAA